MREPYRVLIGKGRPTNLFEAQERACEIEENTTFSLCQDEDCVEEIIQINQVADLTIMDPTHDVRTYLQRERQEVANKVVGHVMSLLGKDKEPTSEEIPPPIRDMLKVERKRAARQAEEKLLQDIQEFLTEPRKEKKLLPSRMKRILSSQIRPKNNTLSKIISACPIKFWMKGLTAPSFL